MPAHTPLTVSARSVRRFLLEAQVLTGTPSARRATTAGALRLIRRLEAVQLDPVAAVERNQHLVLAARMPGYSPALLERLLVRRRIFEYWANAACVMPIEDYPFFEGARRRRHGEVKPGLSRHRGVVTHILNKLEKEGPLPSRAFVSEDKVHGWWDIRQPRTKVTSHVLNELSYAGLVMVVRRQGVERYFDLPERSVPAPLLREAQARPLAEADQALFEKYLRAYRVFELGDFRFGWRRIPAPQRRRIIDARVADGSLVRLRIGDVRRPYFIHAHDAPRLRRFEGRAGAGDMLDETMIRFLPPLDNLLWRRERVIDLFGFRYAWEVYVPEAKRRFGYYTMPILAGDRLIGLIDPRLDRTQERMVIKLLHLEPSVRPSRALRRSLRAALDAFASFHRARALTIERSSISGL